MYEAVMNRELAAHPFHFMNHQNYQTTILSLLVEEYAFIRMIITVNDGEECDSFRHSTFTSRSFDNCQRFNVFNKRKSLRTSLVLPEGAG
ncbi:hypothetical protein NC652_028879 [Populus alba x Populus x berolinensis]|nr:hypothetical protein NC652_028879 [Populus alba x Populus x berolinensis]